MKRRKKRRAAEILYCSLGSLYLRLERARTHTHTHTHTHTLIHTYTLRGLKGEANLVGYQKMSLLMKANEGLKGGLVCVCVCVCVCVHALCCVCVCVYVAPFQVSKHLVLVHKYGFAETHKHMQT